ncbi:MAG TPA: MscL family protein [Candidatus Saccharimonadales bacterium]|jgi:large conductance mechanosensitive channel protein|nr:MscL family protein [Candidatus Saccharimonadales bacterium]
MPKNSTAHTVKPKTTHAAAHAKVHPHQHIPAIPNADMVNELVNKQVNGFLDFLRAQSVVGLAIGLVLGTQVKQLVDSVVANFINPITQLLLPGTGTLPEKSLRVHIGSKTATFGWGSFLSTLLTFVIVAAVVYYTFKILKLDKLQKKS